MDHFYFFIYFLGVKISWNQWLLPPFRFSAASTFSWCLFVAYSALGFVFSKVSCVGWHQVTDSATEEYLISLPWETPLTSIQAHNLTGSMLWLCYVFSYILIWSSCSWAWLVVFTLLWTLLFISMKAFIRQWRRLLTVMPMMIHLPSPRLDFFFRCYEVFFLYHGNNSSFQLPFAVFQAVWCCWAGHCIYFFKSWAWPLLTMSLF